MDDPNVVFVDATAASEGDGSLAEPLQTIASGLELASTLEGAGIVAIAGGTYRETLEIDKYNPGVEILGRCAELVVIDGSNAEEGVPAIMVQGKSWATFRLDGVTVAGSSDHGIHHKGGTLVLSRARLVGNHFSGLTAQDPMTQAELHDVVVSSSELYPDVESLAGIQIVNQASLVISSSTIRDIQAFGIAVDGEGTTAVLEDVDLLDMLGSSGMKVQAGADVTYTRGLVRGNVGAGISASGPGTTVVLTNVDLAETRAESDGGEGYGLAAIDQAFVSVFGGTSRANEAANVYAEEDGTVVELNQVQICGGEPVPGGSSGGGVIVKEGARAFVSSSLVQGCSGFGVLVGQEGAYAELDDVLVADTQFLSEDSQGNGVLVLDGASLRVTSSSLRSNQAIGLIAFGAGTVAEMVDVDVRDTRPRPDGLGGFGVVADEGAQLTATRGIVEGNRKMGVGSASEGSHVELIDVEILDTGGSWGNGLEVSKKASLHATGVVVSGSTQLGLFATEEASVHLEDVEIIDTNPTQDLALGFGLMVEETSSLVASRLVVRGSVGVGVYAQDSAYVHLSNAEIVDTHQSPYFGMASGMLSGMESVIEVEDTLVHHTNGPGLIAADRSAISCVRCTVEDNRWAGIALMTESRVTVVDSMIRRTTVHSGEGGGMGIFSGEEYRTGYGPNEITVMNTVVEEHPLAAVYLQGAGSFQFTDNSLFGSTGIELTNGWVHGNALFAADGITPWIDGHGLLLQGNAFVGSDDAGVLLDDASAMLVGNTWSSNSTDLVQQNCGDLDDTQTPPIGVTYENLESYEICPTFDRMTLRMNFEMVFAEVSAGQ